MNVVGNVHFKQRRRRVKRSVEWDLWMGMSLDGLDLNIKCRFGPRIIGCLVGIVICVASFSGGMRTVVVDCL